MTPVSPAIQNLTRRLLALEAARAKPSDVRGHEGVRICEKLRRPLSTLMGTAGFSSLLTRALTLAKAQVASLATVKVRTDGTLEEFGPAETNLDLRTAGHGGAALVAQLLNLLVTFIGEPLTLRLVSDIWPEVSMNATNSEREETI